MDAIDATTEDGRERLKKIVATLLNSYLAQLLESGFLHADPHPGNFLCTPDGRLCVLDMGLMTEVRDVCGRTGAQRQPVRPAWHPLVLYQVFNSMNC